jgi:hypothetical protein
MTASAGTARFAAGGLSPELVRHLEPVVATIG